MTKKEQLLTTALKQFVEFGFHATPTSKIAKEAGIANGTLFHHFKTKEELIVALFLQTNAHLSNSVYSVVNQDDAFKETLKRIFIKTIDWALENKTEYLFLRQFSTSPFYSLISPEEIANQKRPLLTVLETGIHSNLLKPLPVEFLYNLVNSHINGVIHYLSSTNLSREKQQEIINEAFDLLGV